MSGSLPLWLLSSKQEITQSHQWPSFMQELSEALQQQIKENHIDGNISSLSATERKVFLERALETLKSALHNKISSTLDRQLNKEVRGQMLEGGGEGGLESRTDLVLVAAQDAILGLLQKWPDLRNKLYVCFNYSLSLAMRPIVWRLCLHSESAGSKFEEVSKNKPEQLYNKQISTRCSQTLRTHSSAARLNNSHGAEHVMTAVLSYVQSLNRRTEISNESYQHILPFLLVNSNSIPSKERATLEVVTLIAEEFLTFINSLPPFLKPTETQADDEGQMKLFSSRVAHHLRQISPESSRAISNTYLMSEGPVSIDGAGGAMTQPSMADKETLTRALSILCRPIIRNMFVGYVSVEVLLYIWDQYMIGLSSSQFCDEYLPAISALFFHLVYDKFNKCTSIQQMAELVQVAGNQLTVNQFQFEMKKCFYEPLSQTLRGESLNSQSGTMSGTGFIHSFTVIDEAHRWQAWFTTQTSPVHTTATEKKTLREEREREIKRVEQSDLLQQQLREMEHLKQELEEEKRKQENQARHFQKEKWINHREKENLKQRIHQLERERQMHQQQSNEDDDELKAAVLSRPVPAKPAKTAVRARPKSGPTKSEPVAASPVKAEPVAASPVKAAVSPQASPRAGPAAAAAVKTRSSYRTFPPASTRDQGLTGPTPPYRTVPPASTRDQGLTGPTPPYRAPSPKRPPTEQARDVMADIINKMAASFKKIVNGEGLDRDRLDRETLNNVETFKRDMKKAEVQVLGEGVKFENISEEERKVKVEEIMKVIHERSQERYKQSLRI